SAWCSVLVLGAGCVVLAQQQPPPPRFSSSIERIVIDVQVVDNQGRPLTQLGVADFEVLFDRQPRTIASAQLVVAADVETVSAGAAAPAGRSVTSAAADSAGGRDF